MIHYNFNNFEDSGFGKILLLFTFNNFLWVYISKVVSVREVLIHV